MTKHHRLLDAHGAETAMPIVVKVGAADSAGTDAHEHVLRPERRRFGVLLHSQVEWCMNDETTHGT